MVCATARKNSLTRMLEASITNRGGGVELTTVPVEVIAGDARVGAPKNRGGQAEASADKLG